MKKFLEIDIYFKDGISTLLVNCIDIPVGVAAGYYDRSNYFYYLFNYCAVHNWTAARIDNWLELRNNILGKLGLAAKPWHIEDPSELMPFIHQYINEGKPLLMPTKYKDLFYYYLAGDPNHSHFILINGYDSACSRVFTREITHIGESGMYRYLTNNSVGLFNLYLSDEVIVDIWKKCTVSFSKIPIFKDRFYSFDGEFGNRLFSVEKEGESRINSFDDMIKDFLECYYPHEDNKLVAIVKDYNNLMQHINDNNRPLKHAFLFSVTAIFQVLEKVFEPEKEEGKGFYELKDRYIRFREELVLKMINDAKEGTAYSDSYLDEITQKIYALDEELFALVRNLYSLGVKCNP